MKLFSTKWVKISEGMNIKIGQKESKSSKVSGINITKEITNFVISVELKNINWVIYSNKNLDLSEQR